MRRAQHQFLSSRVMVVFQSVLVFAVRPAVNVPRNTLSNKWGLSIGRQKMSFTECAEVPDFPEICAEPLSVDAWHLVDYGRFVRDKDILLPETRSALRAVQSPCERHRDVPVLFLLASLALVLLLTKGRTCKLVFSMGAVGSELQLSWITILRC